MPLTRCAVWIKKSILCTAHFSWCLMWEPVAGKKRPLQSDILRHKSGHGPKHPHCQSGNHLQHAEHPPGSQQVYSHPFGILWRGTCWQVTHSVILRSALLAVSQDGPQRQPQGNPQGSRVSFILTFQFIFPITSVTKFQSYRAVPQNAWALQYQAGMQTSHNPMVPARWWLCIQRTGQASSSYVNTLLKEINY